METADHVRRRGSVKSNNNNNNNNNSLRTIAAKFLDYKEKEEII